jgi:hypothetical protein
MMIETLNPSGTVTAACERMVVTEDSHVRHGELASGIHAPHHHHDFRPRSHET